ncbi:hypothetical protein CSA37_12990 [Candidatus Fermentibacteria bacterium]|nr:MAG: hypothetical protein CSA37_12990 [Candidatus Fermentibacteria bacterium]
MYLGIVEGFYGKPFTHRQRLMLIEELSELEGASYFYAPKNDPWHRLLWREEYPSDRWNELRNCMGGATSFFFSISPWMFRDREWRTAREKLLRAEDAGASGLGILFDDVPEESGSELAARQLSFAEKALKDTALPVILCPSVYCGEFMERFNGACGYLEAWRKLIPEKWTSFWTGPEVVSRELSDMEKASELLGGRPAVWDNLTATDYALRRIFLPGLSERFPEGYSWFLNPSEIFPAALYCVMELKAASGLPRQWPEALGEQSRGWELMQEFHCTPWKAGDTGEEIIARISEALDGRNAAEALQWLDGAAEDMKKFIEGLPVIEGGWGLMPVARDLYRTMSILARSLQSDAPGKTLNYLMRERLPYENPLTELAAGKCLGG